MTVCARCRAPVADVRRYRARLRRAGLAGAQLPPLCPGHERLLYIAIAARLPSTERPRENNKFGSGGASHDAPPDAKPAKSRRAHQPSHVVDTQLGGNVGDVVLDGKRVRLRVLHPRPVPAGFEFVTERGRLPRTRGDCPPVDAAGVRWCPFVRCRHHMWRIDGEARPGRRWTDHDHRPHVISMRAPFACALDVVDAHNALPMTHGEIGAAMGVCSRQIRRAFNAAVRSSTQLAEAERLLEEMVNR